MLNWLKRYLLDIKKKVTYEANNPKNKVPLSNIHFKYGGFNRGIVCCISDCRKEGFSF